MANLLKAEGYKLLHSRCFWGMTVGAFLLESLLLLDSIQHTDNLFYAALYNTPILYFFTIIFAALFIGEEFGNRTIDSVLCAGHSRQAIFLSKGIFYEIASLSMLSISLLAYGIYAMMVSSLPLAQFLRDSAMAFISISAMCSLPLLCAFLFKDIGKTLALPMVLFFISIFILNGDNFKTISTILPMGQLRLISLQELPVSIFVVIVIDILWIAVGNLCAYMVFRRADLK